MFEVTEILSKGLNQYKIIDIYTTFTCIIPIDIKYIATDETGEIYGFYNKPILIDNVWSGTGFEYLGRIKYSGNWKESLVEI